MDDDAYFAVSSLGSGNGGYLRVIADDLSLRHASYLSSAAHGSGKAGNIEVTVTNTLLMKGRNDVPYSVPTALGDPTPPEVYTTGNNTIASFAYPESQGGGQITIRAGKLEMHDDAFIKATNYAQTGTAGHVSVTADTILLRSGAQIKNDNFQDTARVLVGEGDSGDLDITVGKIDIAGGGEVHAHSALSTDTYGPGRGGNINVTAEELVLHDGGAIISRSLGEGDAGHININSDSITLNNAGTISTEAANAGGGQIEMYADGLLRADNSQITTSVQNGAGNGGDLDIAAQFVVQDRAPITARAVEGDGGNIQIATKGIYQFGGASVNPIDASSKFGVSGEVELETPNKNLNESVFIVSGQFLRSTGISLEHCQHLNEQNVSRLRIRTETSDIGKLPGDFLE